MSYIVAFLKFKESSKSLYPFGCTRDDLVPGDKVIVRTKDQRLSVAFVNKLEYWVGTVVQRFYANYQRDQKILMAII